MKTKIASLCLAAVFSILAFATNSSAADDGFYDKEHIRGFVSLGGDFRGMLPGFHDYINDVAFAYGSLRYRSDSTIYQPTKAPKYSKFNKFYPANRPRPPNTASSTSSIQDSSSMSVHSTSSS